MSKIMLITVLDSIESSLSWTTLSKAERCPGQRWVNDERCLGQFGHHTILAFDFVFDNFKEITFTEKRTETAQPQVKLSHVI